MDRIWQWAWDRYATRYSWAVCAITILFTLPIYGVWSIFIVAVEESSQYVEAGVAAVVAVPLLVCLGQRPGSGWFRPVERWAAGQEVERSKALEATYVLTRGVVVQSLVLSAVWAALLFLLVGRIAGAPGSQLVQYAILGAAIGIGVNVIGVHSMAEAAVRPARAAITAGTGIGDSLPRSRPTFAMWSSASMLAAIFTFAIAGAMWSTVFNRVREEPILFVVIGCALALGFGLPITVGAVFAPSLRPIRDLADGTERVAAGDYSQRLPVVQDDDLGALAASFNRMQAGLAERQRLQAAFGTYVDPGARGTSA